METSPANVKAQLALEGVSIAEWARANGYSVRTVYAVLYGELKATRGISHEIAVAIGLKPKPRRRPSAKRGS